VRVIEALLWDFGDTLVDERWMHTAPPDFPDWPYAWADVMACHANDWNVGRISESDIFRALGARTGLSVKAVEAHAVKCCESLRFHVATWAVAMERRLPQALVTVNPDLFVERIAKRYDLARYFDVIVVSALERTDDKTVLCDIALDRLGLTGSRSASLLIDNREELVEAWKQAGGLAYWYRGDDAFAADPPSIFN
jgi:FMN phosphatase YigB (HAD superfamily)